MAHEISKQLVRTLTAVSLVLVLCALSVELPAQVTDDDDTAEKLLACDPIPDPAEKMACFDAVVKSIKDSDERPVADTVHADSPIDVVEAPSTAAVVTTSVPVVAAKDAARAEAQGDTLDAETAARMSTDNSGTIESSPQVTSKSPDSDFGLEDQKAMAAKKDEKRAKENEKGKDKQSVHATIVTVTATIDDRFEVLLDNGQAWRETEGSRIRTPKKGSAVVITSGAFGSFMMKIGDDPRRARVRRTK